MEQFAYSFALTMMHSIWQMALLLMCYYAAVSVFRKWPPLAKRNLLLLVLAAQFISSAFSFYFIYSSPFLDFRENIQALLQSFSASQSWLQQYAPLLFTVYTAGLVFKIINAWFNWNRFNQQYKTALLKPSVELRLFAESKALHFGIKRKVKVWCSQHIQSPVTFGFFKPVILLPVALVNQLNIQQTESLIVHELTHIKNNDYLFNWFMLLTDALFFFNPFVKIIVQKIKVEREKSCDVQVLQFNYPAIGYAEALLHIAQLQQYKPMQATVAAVNKKTELLDRILYFSDNNNVTPKQTKYFSISALLIWTFIAANIFFAALFVTVPNKPLSLQPLNSFAANPLNEWNKAFSTSALDDAAVTSNQATAIEAAHEMVVNKPDEVSAVKEESLEAPAVEADYIEPSATFPSIKLTPVSYNEAVSTQPEIVKEIVINEESNGVKTTKVFRITGTANGEFKMEPLWMTSEVKPSDSLALKIKADSSIYMVVPAVVQ